MDLVRHVLQVNLLIYCFQQSVNLFVDSIDLFSKTLQILHVMICKTFVVTNLSLTNFQLPQQQILAPAFCLQHLAPPLCIPHCAKYCCQDRMFTSNVQLRGKERQKTDPNSLLLDSICCYSALNHFGFPLCKLLKTAASYWDSYTWCPSLS